MTLLHGISLASMDVNEEMSQICDYFDDYFDDNFDDYFVADFDDYFDDNFVASI